MTSSQSRASIPDAVLRIAQLVEVQAIRVVKVSAETVKAGPKDEISELNLSLRIGSQKGPHPRALYAVVGIDIQPMSKADPQRALAKLSCDVAVHYLLPTEDALGTISDQDAEQFAAYNGVYNVWPYARELMQSLSVRMMLPLVTLPLYRPGMFAPSEQIEQENTK